MGDVEIPKWLNELPLAPEFRPTDTEFADPIAYISKIEKEASAYGICKVIPPLPKPSKKYVLANLNKSLLKCPELGDDVKLSNVDNKVNKGESRAVFTTRHQELGHNSGKRTKGGGVGAGQVSQPPLPAVHKQVWQSGEIYTLEQFESKSKAFAKNQLAMVKEVSPLVIEALFWKASCEKPIYIEYANDVPGSGFGEPEGPFRLVRRRRRRRRTFRRNDQESSAVREVQDNNSSNYDEKKGESKRCTTSSSVDILEKDTSSLNTLSDHVSRQKGPDSGHEIEGTSGWKLSNSPWNLQVIARSPGSLTRFMPDDIPGVTSPMIYIGMLFSWFAWHVEDHELHSLNFLHVGSPKTWYAVPGDYAFTFEEVIRSKAYGGGIDRLAALTLLGEKTTLLSPETVVASGIPCCRLVQNPGEFVVTFPRAYHIGFSHGFNCGEAANFGTSKWLAVAKEAAVRRAAMNFLPMLSHQQLLYLLTMSFIPRVPRSLLPGIRSSRLRDRQKEERELLVKKVFVEDILKENKLLTSLLKRSSFYHAVLWDLESLPPSVIKESDLSSIATDNIMNPPIENVLMENDNNQDKFSQTSLDAETLLYIENDDISSDFQVDSGTLPCVACGVLGFPFMSVIQPSEKALIENVLVKDHNLVQYHGIQNSMASMVEDSGPDEVDGGHASAGDKVCCDHRNRASSETELVHADDRSLEASTDSSKVDVDERWNTSNGYLRPRIFCLEHAIKVEEMLHSRGGAKLLIICHSDFKKIKAQAAAIAEEIGTKFRYNEIQLDDATQDDLNLINIAIDNEQEDDCADDWTLKLNVNLRQSVKLRDKSSSEKIQHALTLDALFADSTPTLGAVIRQWQARKSRSNRKLNRAIHKEPSKNILTEKDMSLEANLSKADMPAKEKKLIQYSRRCVKSKQHGSLAGLGKSDTKATCSLDLGVFSTIEKSEVQHIKNFFPAQVAEEVAAPALVVENAEAQTDTCKLKEMEEGNEGQDGKCGPENSSSSLPCASKSIGNAETEKDDGIAEETSMSNETSHLVTENDSEEQCGREANEDVLMQECSELGKSSGSCIDEHVMDLNDRIQQEVQITHRSDGNTSNPSKSRNHSKRKREVELLRGEQSDVNGFIRSPCEGLRPRGGKDADKSWIIDRMQTIEEKPVKKKARKESSELKTPKKDEKENRKGYHRCDQEGCKLSFKTKAELSLHRKNRCPHEGCGKKFSSHKYAVLHVRVHEDDRPLKCSWKGCKMTFKWAWARTEHLRVHTGERPYKCQVEGCGRTFRFVSDYSRHRRKTGHYVNV